MLMRVAAGIHTHIYMTYDTHRYCNTRTHAEYEVCVIMVYLVYIHLWYICVIFMTCMSRTAPRIYMYIVSYSSTIKAVATSFIVCAYLLLFVVYAQRQHPTHTATSNSNTTNNTANITTKTDAPGWQICAAFFLSPCVRFKSLAVFFCFAFFAFFAFFCVFSFCREYRGERFSQRVLTGCITSYMFYVLF